MRLLAVLLAVSASGCEDDGDLETHGATSHDDDAGGAPTTSDDAGDTTEDTGETSPTTIEDETTGENGTTDASTGTGTPPPGEPDQPRACEALPPAEGNVVGPNDEWESFIESGSSVLLTDGVYTLTDDLVIPTGVTVRSASGNRDAVTLELPYTGHVILKGSDVTLADLTIRGGQYPVSVDEDPFAGYTTGVLIHNLRIVDVTGTGIQVAAHVDEGEIRCSSLEPAAPMDGYVFGADHGIELAGVLGWQVRDNYVGGFVVGIQAWRDARDTVIDRNVIAETALGIVFGSEFPDVDGAREWVNPPYGPDCGHIDGIARNNIILSTDPAAGDEGYEVAGISLRSVCGVDVYNNTIVALHPQATSIELRFAADSVQIANNLIWPAMASDDGVEFAGAANLVDALDSVVDAVGGRLHLVAGSPAIDAGVEVEVGAVVDDFDGDPREGKLDIGADEFN